MRSTLAFHAALFLSLGVAALAIAQGSTPSETRVVDFQYMATVEQIPDGSEKVAVWVPLPQWNDSQKVNQIRFDFPGEPEILEDARFGNRFVYTEVANGEWSDDQALNVVLTFQVTRSSLAKLAERSPQQTNLPMNPFFLEPSRMIQTGGAVADEARRVAGNETDRLKQARLLYDNIVDTFVYDKSGDGWGRGDSLYACDVRKGNCTDFHSLFIGEARSLGIPSRFVMGFSLPVDASQGSIDGYHCWAEFHHDDYGWVPVDASEASKDPSLRERLFGGLDANRVQFTVGRDIVLPQMEGEAVNFSVYPYVEVDGKPFDSVTYKFAYRNH